ncbi:MAG: hypothetical protein BM562_09135 [Alphaproteobacteria bacterium MedPE-SWcel]|nr:MAG: hypothetical protein BM562_09135 [Alphaproteobacteria bacterium MedPE-SWcel]
MIGAWKLAPALAMGKSVVLKPAKTASLSLSLLRLAEICADCGLPDGVLNVVTGPGAATGAALAEHMDVDVLVFTGSGATGRRLLTGSGGTYMAPTVVTGVTERTGLFQQEVFGPVLAVTGFETEAEALLLANAPDYGLAARVWTQDLSRAHRCVAAIRAGVVHVNTYGGADNTVPLGGVGQSGNGHDKSLHALEKYRDLKVAWMQM